MASETQTYSHTPVLIDEISNELLSARTAAIAARIAESNEQRDTKIGDFGEDRILRFVDCTFGGGGHAARLIQDAIKLGIRLECIGFDRDPDRIQEGQQKYKALIDAGQLRLIHAEFSKLDQFVSDHSQDAVLADLGFSSFQIDDPLRGFSFKNDGPIDMRMNPKSHDPRAFDLLATLSEEDLADIFFKYGEERLSRRIARSVVFHRDRGTLKDSTQFLASLVEQSFSSLGRKSGQGSNSKNHGGPSKKQRGTGRIHPATRVFQALRIKVNDELGEIEKMLGAAKAKLKKSGRIAVISFHSLEDRLVKHYYLETDMKATSKKVIIATDVECDLNPRSRSAKLRVFEKL